MFLGLEGTQVMLEQFHAQGWNVTEPERPSGRGINFQIEVSDIQPMLERLRPANHALYRPRNTNRRVPDDQQGEVEFLVQNAASWNAACLNASGTVLIHLERTVQNARSRGESLGFGG